MKFNKNQLITLLCASLSVLVTWYINHEMGYGPIVANGLVGVIAAILLSAPLAGATYTASFVGMSAVTVIPSLLAAAIGGLVVGGIIILTKEIYVGVGGKGGTTAALSALITRTIMSILG